MRWLVVCITGLVFPGLALALQLTPEEALGKRIYLQGVSDSGIEIAAHVGAADTRLPASLLPCGGCHGSDGLGRPEGGVRPPAITWQRLVVPYGQRHNGRRYPAYDEATLARAITDGLDSAGNQLDPAMPRFELSASELQALTAYIKRLDEDRDPGVEANLLRLGTLVPRAGPLAAAGRTLVAVLSTVLEQINTAGGIHGRRLELLVADCGTDAASTAAALEWLVAERVFALIAPLPPVAEVDLSEWLSTNRLPVIGPRSPLASGTSNPMVFDVLPGLREQLLTLGQFASQQLSTGKALILYQHSEQHVELAAQLAEQLSRAGWQQVRRQGYRGTLPMFEAYEPDALFFLGNGDELLKLGQALQRVDHPPALLAISAQVADSVLKLPEVFSDRLYLGYPFLPSDWTEEGAATLARIREQAGLDGHHILTQVSTLAAAQVLIEGLRRAGRDVNRVGLIRSLESLYDFRTGLTPALQYGPGQRSGAAGAHIVKVDIVTGRFRPEGGYWHLQNTERR